MVTEGNIRRRRVFFRLHFRQETPRNVRFSGGLSQTERTVRRHLKLYLLRSLWRRCFQFYWYKKDNVPEGFTLDHVRKHAEKTGLDVVESQVADFGNPVHRGPVLFAVMQKR